MARYLITSALPYINGIKHLGNLTGSLLPADVYARFLRREGEEVLFICATDEHCTPAELSALEANLDVSDYCHRMHEKQAVIYRRFGLSFDHFGRSSSPQNHELTQHVYQQLQANGYIESRATLQAYSNADHRFLPDRYVFGTCPKCGYAAARGDQCESCTSLLDPTDLLNPRSALSNSDDLDFRPTQHLFLKLDALTDDIRTWIAEHPNWPTLTKSIAHKWLDEGLQERCITRDLQWGVPVPEEGFAGKVFYVWFDAPIAYIAATKAWSGALQPSAAQPDRTQSRDSWKDWWWQADDVIYTQFMAKDNVPFHTVFWPGVMLGTREPWTMAQQIKSFNWLTYYGGKFSTSQKRGVFMDAALDILSPDVWRYFLMAQSPESDDANFTWELLATVVNKDLAGILGNFVNRVLRLTQQSFGEVIPTGGQPGDVEARLEQSCLQVFEDYRSHLRNLEFRKAAQSLRTLWTLGNGYLDARAPWRLIQRDRETTAMVLRTAIHLMRIFAIASEPVLPFTGTTILDALRVPEAERDVPFDHLIDFAALPEGHPFEIPDILFRRIEPADIETWRERFGASDISRTDDEATSIGANNQGGQSI